MVGAVPSVTHADGTARSPWQDDAVPVVEARRLVKRYGSTVALDGVDVAIGSGITGLLGANGAGKTTLLGLILGLHAADQGELSVLGRDPRRAGPEVRARIGYAPEHHTLPPDVAAASFVRHLAELHGLPREEATTRASDALWLVGLGEERFRPLGTMSTGQRQRVKLAQAIAHDPGLVLLDEPTDGLDPVQRDQMLALIRRIADEFGIDVILSSHLLDEVERICDHAVILSGGRVVAAGTIEGLRGDNRGVTVEVDGGAEGLVLALEAAGLTVRPDGRRLVVEGTDDSAFDRVRDAIAALDLGLVRLDRRRLSLEDVYLERTR
jgi:ABC-2 type transport system ATP-binding protein